MTPSRTLKVKGKGKGKEEKGKERKKVHLQTDQDRAQLVKLCTKHFSRYSGEKEKFWKYRKRFGRREGNEDAPPVKEFMNK
jgi:hypothetical protein